MEIKDTNEITFRKEKLCAGLYRLCSNFYFANIRKNKKGWNIEVRDSNTKEFMRYANDATTFKEAIKEAKMAIKSLPQWA